MIEILYFVIASMSVASLAVILYVVWRLAVRPLLPWERRAQEIAAELRKRFEGEAVGRAVGALDRAASPGERREWKRVLRYLKGSDALPVSRPGSPRSQDADNRRRASRR